MLPDDFNFEQIAAIAFLFIAWFAYSFVLKIVSRGSLNEQLSTVRARWLATSLSRAQKPFDAILLGHIVNSIAFFGSATLIVLAGLVTLFANARSVHEIAVDLSLTTPPSFELFVTHVAVLTVTLASSFFSFTYALRKLIYTLALIGALPETVENEEEEKRRRLMVDDAALVLSEALKTFNFGIRGYYYSVAAIGLFVSPYLCIILTVFMTTMLIFRQVGTPTAKAIRRYVDTSKEERDTS
ncbi:MAG: DUF599 family protein [Pseudomonadota bacterium]